MNCNIVSNQQSSFLPTSERSASETKTKDQKRVEVAHRDREKVKGKALKRQLRSTDDLKRIYEFIFNKT